MTVENQKDGCPWIYDTGDQQSVALIPDAIECVRKVPQEIQMQPIIPVHLSGRLRIEKFGKVACVSPQPPMPS